MNPIRSTTLMTRWRLWPLMALAGLTSLTGPASGQAPATPAALPARETYWGKPVHGVQAGIRKASDSTTVHIGDRISIELVMRNTTDHDIDFAYGNAQRIYGWQVKQQKDGAWEIAPRWRYWQELKLEGVVAGAMELRLAARGEMAVPMDGPEILVSNRPQEKPNPSGRLVKLSIPARPGTIIRLRALPITAAARGEEWLDKLETGVVALKVDASGPGKPGPVSEAGEDTVSWGPAVDGIEAGLRLDPPRRSAAAGEPIWQEVYVRNRGREPITFVSQIGYEEQGRARVTDPAGTPIHVQQYYGIGGMMIGRERVLHPGETIQVGRHAVAFTGMLLDPRNSHEPAPGISSLADGMPLAHGLPGRYLLGQPVSGTIAGKPVTLGTGVKRIDIKPGEVRKGTQVAYRGPNRRPALDLADVPVAWGETRNGLQSGLLFVDGKSHYIPGEKVRIAVVVRNRTDRSVSFWHDASFAQAESPAVTSPAGQRMDVRRSVETEWRPLGELKLTGVTFDMTYAPSAGGPSRTVQSELKPGQATIGYLLASFSLPEAIAAGERSVSVQQAWPVGFGNGGKLDSALPTGRLDLDLVGIGKSGASQSPKDDPAGISWGPAKDGLRIGICYHEGRRPASTGEQLWMDLMVQNVGRAAQTVTYRTGSVYIDPPVEAEVLTGKLEVMGGNSQIVNAHTVTLQPGESALIGHPNYVLYPHVQRQVRGLTVYPELAVDAGDYRLRQSFPVEVNGREIPLQSGPLAFRVAPRKTRIAWGPAVDGLRAGIGFQADRDRYRVGETFGLSLYVENVADEPKTLRWMGNGDAMRVECFDEAGGRVDVRRTVTTILPVEQSITLKPHERYMLNSPAVKLSTREAAPEWRLESIVAQPGRYSLSTSDITEFRRPSDPPRTPLRTGRLWFTILPKQ